MEVDVMSYIAWAQEKPKRAVTIEAQKGKLKIWAYDYERGQGMHPVFGNEIIPADEIDAALARAQEAEDKRRYEALKKKFEGGNE